VRGPALRDDAPGALVHDAVLEAKARAADVDAARPDAEPLVERHPFAVAHVKLDRGDVDAGLDQTGIAAGDPLEIGDPGYLEPDHVDGVVDNPLRVGLVEPGRDLGREAEALHVGAP
jgi:hypothetical protein